MPKKGRASLVDRLHRIEGQVRGVEAMLEKQEDPQKVLAQLQAVISGLERVKVEIVKTRVSDRIQNEILSALDMLQ